MTHCENILELKLLGPSSGRGNVSDLKEGWLVKNMYNYLYGWEPCMKNSFSSRLIKRSSWKVEFQNSVWAVIHLSSNNGRIDCYQGLQQWEDWLLPRFASTARAAELEQRLKNNRVQWLTAHIVRRTRSRKIKTSCQEILHKHYLS